MKKEILTDEAIREFLLGRTSEEERNRIELIFLTDPASKERILVAEQSLLDDYLEGSLTNNDKENFLLQFSQTPAQKEELEIAQFTQESLARRASEHRQAVVPTRSIWRRLAIPRLIVPVAVAAVVVIVLGVIWLNWQRTTQRHLAIEKEIAQLNAPESVKENPAQFVLALAPVTNRGIGPQSELIRRAALSVVELKLRLIQTEATRYDAKLQRIDDPEIFSANNLQIDNDHTIQLRLPAHVLVKGLYKLTLTGITAEGTTSSVQEYQFTVREE
jgi:anti-sigma-K factor RskA